MERSKGAVCVTGGDGFVASWMITRLLEHGYSIRTTVIPELYGSRYISFLTNLPGASERLRIFAADLSDPQSFGPAIEGCVGVFHVATPVDFEDREPEPVVTKRSIDGALGILRACLNSKTVKRVMYTSSGSAVQLNNSSADILDEDSWSDVDSIREIAAFGASYAISKTLTEKAVLEFGERHGLEVVTVAPACVHGPFICPKFAASVRTLLALVLGNENEYSFLRRVSLVHVDDVVRAHIFLFEHPDAKGRYICSAATMTIEEMSKFLSERYPEFQIPSPESLKEVKGHRFTALSSRKLLDAGFEYKYGIEGMFDGAIQCCKEKGYL
ncbi:vestitone reductase-like [Rhodamnia argentea]|uniref:Vestitone reductase-like n=1 Tax=Rhodamnia argentea TaxID=178133 RepID=A0A8B8N8Y4_9MYRT|nr:vestitone reductase-like [Rhodamnia argentea]